MADLSLSRTVAFVQTWLHSYMEDAHGHVIQLLASLVYCLFVFHYRPMSLQEIVSKKLKSTNQSKHHLLWQLYNGCYYTSNLLKNGHYLMVWVRTGAVATQHKHQHKDITHDINASLLMKWYWVVNSINYLSKKTSSCITANNFLHQHSVICFYWLHFYVAISLGQSPQCLLLLCVWDTCCVECPVLNLWCN